MPSKSENTSSAIEMKIKGLMIDPMSQNPIIVLQAPEGDSVLPIWVGLFEANAIALQLEKIETPRPMTHDLLKSLVGHLQADIEKVVITDLKDNTFYAEIHLNQGGKARTIDSRPSDAIALALRAEAPIFVEQDVIDRARNAEITKDVGEADRWKQYLEKLDPEDFGKYEM